MARLHERHQPSRPSPAHTPQVLSVSESRSPTAEEGSRNAAAPGTPAKPPTPATPPSRGVDPALIAWMALLSFLWGLNAISIKAITDDLMPILASGLRGTIALPCLIAYGLARGESLTFRGWPLVHGIVAGLLFALEFCLFYLGARLTNGGHMAIFINAAPFFVAIGAHFLLRGERLSPLRWLGLVLAFLGIVALFSDDLMVQQQGFWRGDLLVILGALAWGLTTLYIKRFMVGAMSGFQLLYVQILVSTPTLLLASLALEPVGRAHFTPAIAAILAFQSLVVVFFSYLAWMTLLRRYPASAMQSFTFLTPVWGVALGVLLLGETVTSFMAVGIAMVGAGLYLVNRPRPGA